MIHHANTIRAKKHTIILLDAEKAFEKNQAPFHDKDTQPRNRKCLQPDKEHLQETLHLASCLMLKN